ncbi:MAG: cell division protein FtsH, partial [Fibrobacterales bacterium]|nr:cell division protein FtsH [Fibrobacterales bacterium]
VILLAATNRPDVLDRALLRPGRLDRSVVVDAPDARGREAILRIHVAKRKVPLADDVSLETIAKGTPGMSGAELENLVNEAALLAARYDAKQVSMIDFEEAKDKLLMGPERRSRVLSDEERRTTAYHEAGHALVTHLVEHSDVLHKLTIIPRGMALGLTFSLPEKDRYTMDRAYLEDQIAILLAGRCADWLIVRQRTTGASNDIERATEIARRMVTEWGMNDEMGPIVYRKKKEDVFLGRDISERQDHSEHTAELIDDLVRKTIEAQNDRVEKILAGNRDKLVALAEALLEHEVLDREEILRVLAGEKLESSKKSRQYQAMRDAEQRRAERKSREGGKKDAKEPGAGNPSEAPESPAEPEPGKAESEGKEDGE